VTIREAGEVGLKLLFAKESDDEQGKANEGERLKLGKVYRTDLGKFHKQLPIIFVTEHRN
jgi:hypothetical protein